MLYATQPTAGMKSVATMAARLSLGADAEAAARSAACALPATAREDVKAPRVASF